MASRFRRGVCLPRCVDCSGRCANHEDRHRVDGRSGLDARALWHRGRPEAHPRHRVRRARPGRFAQRPHPGHPPRSEECRGQGRVPGHVPARHAFRSNEVRAHGTTCPTATDGSRSSRTSSAGDVGLSSGCREQLGTTAQNLTTNDFVVVPIAKNADGSSVTGTVLGPIVNRSGADSL